MQADDSNGKQIVTKYITLKINTEGYSKVI
jgi:hypothetical protein